MEREKEGERRERREREEKMLKSQCVKGKSSFLYTCTIMNNKD